MPQSHSQWITLHGGTMLACSPDTSLSLLEQARDRSNRDAWDRVVGLYTTILRKWFFAAGLQEADCDDLTQRALEILVRQIAEFEHNGRPGAFRAWLRGISVNVLREFWRQRPAAGADSILADLADPSSGLSHLWDREHDRYLLHILLESVRPEFTEPAWTAFRRLALGGASAKDVAAELHTTPNAVLIAKSRVLTRLRREARGLVG
jgi:RNA polymerase sigma-70 factor (ECF subfamily)